MERARVTGVVAAMPEELRELRRSTRIRERRVRHGFHLASGTLGAAAVALVCTGEGRECARRGAQALLDSIACTRLLVLGVSGGLSPELTVGTVLAGRTVLDGKQPAPAPDARDTEVVLRRDDVRAATLVSMRDLLCTAVDKAAAYRRSGAAGTAAVDLETAAFATVAAARGVPYLALRAVSDTAAESLPLDLNLFRDASGRIRRGRIAAHVLLHPRVGVKLVQLNRRVAACARGLARITREILNEDLR